MTYDQYWHGDVWLTKAYQEAHKLKLKQQNAFLHLQGAYIYEALLDVSPVFHAFAKKGTRPVDYVKEPYKLSFEKDDERIERELSEEEIEKKEQQEMLFAKIYQDNLMRHFKEQFGNDAVKDFSNKRSQPKAQTQGEMNEDVQTPRE